MKSTTLILLFICIQIITYAQKPILFKGQVRDSLGLPLEYANVVAVDTTTQLMAGFAVTNHNGQFKLGLKTKTVYQLKITFIGYVPLELTIQPQENEDGPFLFTLNSDVTQLSGVEITAEMPVTVRGDTIIYEVEAFNQGNERKLEDVLEDLPGFEIDEDGGIKVQGEEVNKVLIDGKEFFDGDSKMATKNIPANVVDKVQLLQNFNNISPLRNVNNSEELAINIQLKEDSKQMVFGDATLGGGQEERYYGHLNSFYYDDKTNINLIADANNVGELAFSMRDYFRFARGLGSMSSRNGSTFTMSSDQLGIPMAERNSAADLNNQLIAYNMTLRPNTSWQFTGFAIGSWVDNFFSSSSARQYLQGNSTLDELFISDRFVNSTSGLGKFTATFTPNPSLHLDYQYFGRKATITNGENEQSFILEEENDILGENEQSPWSSEHQLSGFYAVGDNDVISMEASYKNQHQDPIYSLSTTRQPFVGTIPLLSNDTFNLQQNRLINTRNFESVINYYHVINRKNHIRLNAGYSDNQQEYNARLSELGEENEALETTAFLNNASFIMPDHFVGILYKNKWKRLTWIPQLDFHSYEVQYDQETSDTGFTRNLLLPRFSAKYQIRNSQSIQFVYAKTAQFMDIQRITTNLVLSNYNLLARGNIFLRNSVYHTFSLNYSNFIMYTFLNVYGGLNFERRTNDIQNNFELNQLERVSTPENVLTVNEQGSGYLNIEKRFDRFRIGVTGNWTYSLVNNQLNDLPNQNENIQQVYEGFASTRLFEKISAKVSYELTLNDYNGNQSENTFINEELAVKLDYEIVKGLEWSSKVSLNNYRSADNRTSSTYNLLDSSIKYRKEGSPWEFGIRGMNLLNTANIRRDSFTDNLISTYEFTIQPRYFLMTVMFDF